MTGSWGTEPSISADSTDTKDPESESPETNSTSEPPDATEWNSSSEEAVDWDELQAPDRTTKHV